MGDQTHISVMRGTHTCLLYNAPQPQAKLQRVQKGLLIIYKHMVYKSGLRRSGGIGTFYGRSAGEIMSRAEMSGTFFSDEDCEAVEGYHSTFAAWGFLLQCPQKIGVHVVDVLVLK